MPAPGPHVEMPFIEHLRELRTRVIRSLWALVIGAAVGFIYYRPIVGMLLAPFHGIDLQYLEVSHGFLLKIRVSLYAGVILSFPLHLYNVVAFIVPALELKERRILWGLLAGSSCLVLFGGYMGYFQILPLAVNFLNSAEFVVENAKTNLDIFKAIHFEVQMLLAFLILFQWPMVMLVLMWGNVVSRQQFFRLGRYFIVLIFIVSAVLTPPDIISQVGLAIPLAVLYYLAILLAKAFHFGDENA